LGEVDDVGHIIVGWVSEEAKWFEEVSELTLVGEERDSNH
jgi:hypothetical protein